MDLPTKDDHNSYCLFNKFEQLPGMRLFEAYKLKKYQIESLMTKLTYEINAVLTS